MYTRGDIYPEGKGGGLTEHGYHIQCGYAISVKNIGNKASLGFVSEASSLICEKYVKYHSAMHDKINGIYEFWALFFLYFWFTAHQMKMFIRGVSLDQGGVHCVGHMRDLWSIFS